MKPSISKFLVAGLIAIVASAAQAQNVTVQYTLTDQNGATRPRSYVTFNYGNAQGPGNQIIQRAGSGYGTVEIPAMQSVVIHAKDSGCIDDIQRFDSLQPGSTYSFQFVLQCQ